MSELTPDQADFVERVRQRMAAVNSPSLRGRGRPRGVSGTCSLCGTEGHYRSSCPDRQAKKRRAPTRVDGQNLCQVCGERGHNSARHTAGSASAKAVKAVIEENLSYREAAERFGISRQAVSLAVRLRHGDLETPTEAKYRLARMRAVTLAVCGKTLGEITQETCTSKCWVSGVLADRGLSARDPNRKFHDEEISAVLSMVADGFSYADIAAALGCSENSAGRVARENGATSQSTSRGRKDGRVSRAIARVEAGESVPDACRAECCSTVSVYVHFKRLRERQP